jgi:hypothetical protein
MPVPNPPPGRFGAANVGLLGSFISGLVTTLVSPSIAHRQKAACVVLLERRPPPPCSVTPRPGRCGVGIVLQVTHPPLPQPRTGSRTVFGRDGVTIRRSTPTPPSPLPMRFGQDVADRLSGEFPEVRSFTLTARGVYRPSRTPRNSTGQLATEKVEQMAPSTEHLRMTRMLKCPVTGGQPRRLSSQRNEPQRCPKRLPPPPRQAVVTSPRRDAASPGNGARTRLVA